MCKVIIHLLLICLVAFLYLPAKSFTPKDFALNPNINFLTINGKKIIQMNFNEFPFDGTLFIKSKRIESESWDWIKSYCEPSKVIFDTLEFEPTEYGIELVNDSLIASQYLILGNSDSIYWDNGAALILIDKTLFDSIASEIDLLRLAMFCDGWATAVEIVPRCEGFNPLYVSKIKRLINSYIDLYESRLRAVLLIGRIAVAYTGNYTFDGHSDHIGAFPSDLFYVCRKCNWTDDYEYNTTASRTENLNVPFDGKYDQTTLNADIQVAIGRIDFFNLFSLNRSEVELMKKYIAKNLNFRLGGMQKPFRALVDDGFGFASSESFATFAWLNFPVLADTIIEGKFLENIEKEDFLLAYGCNSGSYTSLWSVIDVEQAKRSNLRIAFPFLFGSYLWDWDSENNLLRSVLAAEGKVVGVGWVGRPFWHFHHQWLDRPMAFSLVNTFNNKFLYRSMGKFGYRGAHIEFLGDPTLKLFYPKPIEKPYYSLDRNSKNIVLKWEAPLDTNGFIGTIILKSRQKYSTFELITSEPNENFEYIDFEIEKGSTFYIIRSVYRFNTKYGSVLRLGLGKLLEVYVE